MLNQFLNPPAFGLDLSDLSLKIIHLETKGGNLTLASFNRQEIPQGIIEDGEIKKEKELSKIIKKAIKQVKGEPLKTKYVICSLPETEAFVRVIQVAKNHNIKEAVYKKAKNHIPLPLDQIYLDWQIIRPAKNHLDHYDILIGAMRKNLVDQYVKMLKKTGLKIRALEIESVATSRALIKNDFSPRPILIVDLGGQRTSFIIFSGRTLRFTASVPKCSFKDVYRKIREYIYFYHGHASHEHGANGVITKILLVGGGAKAKKLPSYLEMKLNLPIDLGNPWINIPLKKPRISRDKSLRYATAIGLALRGIKENAQTQSFTA